MSEAMTDINEAVERVRAALTQADHVESVSASIKVDDLRALLSAHAADKARIAELERGLKKTRPALDAYANADWNLIGSDIAVNMRRNAKDAAALLSRMEKPG